MICVSVAEPSAEECARALEGLDFAEVRMDGMDATLEDLKSIFSMPLRLVATCRPGTMSQEERKTRLLTAIDSGASYVDVELENGQQFNQEIVDAARSRRCGVIVSFHDFHGTPGEEVLNDVVGRCFAEGADVCKIACHVTEVGDGARLLGLLSSPDRKGKLVVMGMGPLGRILRVAAPLLGSPFTIASLGRGKETAPGQIEAKSLEDMLEAVKNG